MNDLISFYEDTGIERVGFILDNDTIVEVANICVDSENGFEVRGDDLLRYEDYIKASWHTHPGESSNLSTGDLQSFLNYPNWLHHIIGSDGVATYVVQAGKVIRASKNSSARSAEEVS